MGLFKHFWGVFCLSNIKQGIELIIQAKFFKKNFSSLGTRPDMGIQLKKHAGGLCIPNTYPPIAIQNMMQHPIKVNKSSKIVKSPRIQNQSMTASNAEQGVKT